MKTVCLTFDIEECDFHRKGVDYNCLGRLGTHLLLRRIDVPVTFFVTDFFKGVNLFLHLRLDVFNVISVCISIFRTFVIFKYPGYDLVFQIFFR